MKRFFCVSLLLICSLFFCSNASAGWSSQYTQWVAPGQEHVVYFIPALPGGRDHGIKWCHYYYDSENNSIWSEGGIKMYWAEYPDVSTFHLFGDYGVTTQLYYEDLYAGNDDIFFKFVFENYHDKSIQFVWYFYTDD